jgi:histidine triad (HIT) family protein
LARDERLLKQWNDGGALVEFLINRSTTAQLQFNHSYTPLMTVFEKIIAREIPSQIVYEDESCIAFNDLNPQAPVHVLIVPKKLIPRVGEATAADQATLGALLLAAGKIADQLGVNSTDKGFRLIINHGRDAGETVPHLHVHLLAGRELGWPPG